MRVFFLYDDEDKVKETAEFIGPVQTEAKEKERQDAQNVQKIIDGEAGQVHDGTTDDPLGNVMNKVLDIKGENDTDSSRSLIGLTSLFLWGNILTLSSIEVADNVQYIIWIS